MDVDALVVREGDRVTATGRLVHNEAGDWFGPWHYAFSGGAPRGVRAARRQAVRVIGANFDDLTNRLEDDGAVEGFATVTGIWSGDQLQAIRQTIPENAPHHFPRWITPPCPAPADGWPHLMWGRGDHNLDYDLGDLTDAGAAVSVSTASPLASAEPATSSPSVEKGIARAQELAGEGEIGVGAGEVGGQALPLGLIDHVAIDIVPVVFGRGKPYFGTLADGHLMLEDPEVVIQGDGVLHLRYPVHRGR